MQITTLLYLIFKGLRSFWMWGFFFLWMINALLHIFYILSTIPEIMNLVSWSMKEFTPWQTDICENCNIVYTQKQQVTSLLQNGSVLWIWKIQVIHSSCFLRNHVHTIYRKKKETERKQEGISFFIKIGCLFLELVESHLS